MNNPGKRNLEFELVRSLSGSPERRGVGVGVGFKNTDPTRLLNVKTVHCPLQQLRRSDPWCEALKLWVTVSVSE